MPETVWLLCDGRFDFVEKNYFLDGRDDIRVTTPVNCFLIKTNEGFGLIDTGCGNYFGPSCGHLEKALKKSGHEIRDVQFIFLTHLHPDHIGGLPLFPKVKLFIPKREFEHWINPSQEIEMTERNKKYLPFVRKTIEGHEGEIQLIEPGQISVPTITALAAYGHTPGHTAYLYQNTLFCGDIISDLQRNSLERATVFDHNPQEAMNTRLKLNSLALSRHYTLAGPHLSTLLSL